jgi:hypothetical protein|mmetsp:Transcript_40169/g.66984  ORF Transcript_40169/g.66984 Transcript_40169/m.66984 type:complete len:104 (+) Transcript_40169:496-807(+)
MAPPLPYLPAGNVLTQLENGLPLFQVYLLAFPCALLNSSPLSCLPNKPEQGVGVTDSSCPMAVGLYTQLGLVEVLSLSAPDMQLVIWHHAEWWYHAWKGNWQG